ncbi:hypothetical protein Tco_0190223 [Tanacetum coccineum]
MYASVARFQRQKKAEEKPKRETVKVADRVKEKQASKVTYAFSHSSHSYVSVLNRGVGKKEKGNNMDMKTITLTDHELVHIINSLEVALVKVKSVETMRSLYRLCREEGFNSVKIHHIGGLWLWVQFETLDSCNAFKNNTMSKSLFAAIKPVSRNFCVDERMVWVEISGLPLCTWGSNAFKKVAASVVKFMFFEDDKSAAMSMGRFISEVVKVVIHGEEYDVHIHELGSWSINLDHLSSKNSDSDSKVDSESKNEEDSENEDDLHDLFHEEQVETKKNDKHDM